MPMTRTLVGRSVHDNPIYRYTETGGANAALVAACAPAVPFRFLSAHAVYSAAPAQAGVTTKLDSGAGAAFDSTLNTGAANAQFTNNQPNPSLHLGDNDAVEVTAPAGGVGITASVSVYVEELRSKNFTKKPENV